MNQNENAPARKYKRYDETFQRSTVEHWMSATTPAEFEAESVRKFLKLDVTHIAVIALSRKKLNHIHEALSEADCQTVGWYSPQEFISKLYELAMADPAGGTLEQGKPRKRKIALNPAALTDSERREREDDMLRTLAEAMKPKP